MSKVSAAEKAANSAKNIARKILEAIKTPEQAVALKGAEREKYLKALELVHGPVEIRAKKAGKNLERIKERAETDKFLAEKNIEPVTTRKSGSSFIELQNENGYPIQQEIVLHPPTGGMNSAGLREELRGRGVYQKILEDNAMKGYATGSDDAQRSMDADKVWNRIAKQKGAVKRGTYEDLGIDNPANPYGEVTVLNNDVLKNSLNRVPDAAFDPRFKDSKLLLAGAGAVPMASPTLKNPADMAKKAYEWYVDKLKQGGDLVANKVLETTTPQGLPDREKFIEGNKEWVSEGAQFVGDPLNLVAGAGGLLKAKRAAKAVEGIAEAAKVADKATDASKAVEAAKAVEGMGEAVKAERGIKPMNIVKPSPEQINATIESLRNPKRVAELRNKVKQMRDLSVPQSAAQTPEQLATIRQRLEASKHGFAEAERKIALTTEQRMAEMTPHQRQLYEEQLKREAADTARLIEQEKAAVAADNAPEKLRAEVDARKQRISDDTVSVPINIGPVKSSIDDDIVQQILKRKQSTNIPEKLSTEMPISDLERANKLNPVVKASSGQSYTVEPIPGQSSAGTRITFYDKNGKYVSHANHPSLDKSVADAWAKSQIDGTDSLKFEELPVKKVVKP